MAYAREDVLVSTDWVEGHLHDRNVRLVEVDYDPKPNYNIGHMPGAVLWDWRTDLNHPLVRDVVTRERLRDLLTAAGVTPDTKLVLYGDFNNWFAAFAFWDLKYYGVKNVAVMNGGRNKWVDEDKPLTKDIPSPERKPVDVGDPDPKIRVFLSEVVKHHADPDTVLVDVRSPQEYSGEVLAPPEYPTEHAQRGGHIPGAINIPWAKAVNEDGTFKSPEKLKRLYESNGVTSDKIVIPYCRIGERSSHTWFVLKYLLGYPDVRNYDGSWTEWGNMIRNPIEKPGETPPAPAA